MSSTLPRITLDILPSTGRIENEAQKILFVGQMVKNNNGNIGNNPTGTFNPGTTGTLVTDIPNDEPTNDALYGRRSMIARMLREARKINKVTRFDAFVVEDNPGNTTSTMSVTLSGTATEDGNLVFQLGSATNHTVTIPVLTGESATAVAATMRVVVNADLTGPLFSADPTASPIVALSAANWGEEGHFVTTRTLAVPAGLGVVFNAITGTILQPDLSQLFAKIASERYETIVWPHTYELVEGTPANSYAALIADLEARFNADNTIKDGIAIISFFSNFAFLKDQAESLDTKTLSLYFTTKVLDLTTPLPFSGGSIVEVNYVMSAQRAAIRALRFSEGANIAQFVNATSGGLDNFGGPALASLPYFNTPFDLLPIIPVGKGFTDEEIAELRSVGGSALVNNDANTKIISLESLTLYKTNTSGQPDKSFFFMNSVDTMSKIRELFFNSLKVRYANSRLTNGDLVRGRSDANVSSIKAFIAGVYATLSGPDFVLTQRGEAALRFFKDNLVVTLELEGGKALVFMVVPIVTQLREIEGTVEVTFAING